MVAGNEWQVKYLQVQMHARYLWLGNVQGWDLSRVDSAIGIRQLRLTLIPTGYRVVKWKNRAVARRLSLRGGTIESCEVNGNWYRIYVPPRELPGCWSTFRPGPY